MPFPPSERVFYQKNPLDEVVCQLRFPPILRIDTEAPAAFQDRVRTLFPMYQRGFASPVAIPLPAEVLQAIAGSGGSVHEFATADQNWKLSLTRDFIALSTKAYRQWPDFQAKMRAPLQALETIYAPAFFVRIGLRYRDRIDRKALALEGVEWRDLLRPDALGELADPDVGPHVEHVLRELVLRLTEGKGKVRVVHGIQPEADQLTYIIDCDFFSEDQTPTTAVNNVLDEFNERAGHLFRWYISQRLHAAMEPGSPPAA